MSSSDRETNNRGSFHWRLKRNGSHDESPRSPRFFQRRRSNDEAFHDTASRGANSDVEVGTTRRRQSFFRRSYTNHTTATKGLFSRHQRKSNHLRTTSKQRNNHHIDGCKSDGDSLDRSHSNVSDISSDDANDATPAVRRARRFQEAEQQHLYHHEESLTEALPPPPPPTIDSMPLRKNAVSFDLTMVEAPSQEHTTTLPVRSASDFSSHPRRRGERARYNTNTGNSNVRKQFRVRPYHRFPDGTTMTEEEIYADSLLPSNEYTHVRSYISGTTNRCNNSPGTWGNSSDGRIGTLRVEILGCVRLNRTKPDVCVYAVCGDAAFCTDVVSGYRSPMWPSVSRRACMFPIHHAFAKLYIGVFDCRKRKAKENDSFCGRVAIDISSIRPDTEYDTTVPLRASTFVYDKRKRGVIRMRFAIHWFDERAAVLSYFRPVRSLVDSCPLTDGQPSIPCADPKTFRNVAVTVHGQDLPGKYSKAAFRATIREFNLYQQNIKHICKNLILDIVFYENYAISLYCFGASMYCVYYNSVRLVPAFLVGYLIIIFLENYWTYIENSDFHLGYKPVTIKEVFLALLVNRSKVDAKTLVFEPIKVDKRTKRRRGAESRLGRMNSRDENDQGQPSFHEDDNDGEIKPMDHREFPFADRDAYPKFGVEDALAAGSGGTSRLHGRLSVYYAAPNDDNGSGDEDDSDASDSDHDDETIMTESHMVGDSMFDLDSEAEDEEEMNVEAADFNYKRAMSHQENEALAKNRIRLGPPQDADVTGASKVPPQLQLKKVEQLAYKSSMNISVERVAVPASKANVCDLTHSKYNSIDSLPPNFQKKAKKPPLDDFDKLLGLQSKSANPVVRIMSSFMGPLMRILRVPVYIIRVLFNVTTWRDPYLTFWVFAALVLFCLILIVFPWRSFFLVSTFLCFGPQNILIGKYLKKRAQKKLEEELEDDSEDKRLLLRRQGSKRFGRGRSDVGEDSTRRTAEKQPARRNVFNNRKGKRPSSKEEESVEKERPPFQTDWHSHAASSKKTQPRAVVIPYGRLKKDRFFDWPPDPTVSRATPVVFQPNGAGEVESLSESVRGEPTVEEMKGIPANNAIRRRKKSGEGVEDHTIPGNISF